MVIFLSKKVKKEKEENPFDIAAALEDVSPYLREGLEKFIFNHDIKINNQKEFDEILKIYGGF